jgi:hypothetical protein
LTIEVIVFEGRERGSTPRGEYGERAYSLAGLRCSSCGAVATRLREAVSRETEACAIGRADLSGDSDL